MKPGNVARIATGVVLLALAVVAITWFIRSPHGHQLRENPKLLADDVRTWVSHHPVTAPLVFLTLYTVLSLVMLPVWWLQILGGVAFGIATGTAYALTSAIVAATVTVALSRWLGTDRLRDKAEARLARLRTIDEKLGHNGLLVVMAVRLAHVLPFALANYLFALTRVRISEVAFGTLLGSGPAISIYVTIGAHPRLLHTFKFWGALATANVVLLIPLAIRYLRPEWFGAADRPRVE